MPNENPLAGIVPKVGSDIARRLELRAIAEEAKLLLKNRLEVDDTKHRFHSELGIFKDKSRIIEH